MDLSFHSNVNHCSTATRIPKKWESPKQQSHYEEINGNPAFGTFLSFACHLVGKMREEPVIKFSATAMLAKAH